MLAPLAGFFLFLPICGIFFFLDTKLLNDWRYHIVQMWAKGDIELRFFLKTVSANPILPKATLQSMLTTLPLEGKLGSEEQASANTRQAVAVALLSVDAYRADALAVLATGYMIIAASVILSVAVQTWQPLLGIGLVLLLPLIRLWCKHWRFESALRGMPVARRSGDFSYDHYLKVISSMNWDGIPSRDKERFLAVHRHNAG
jgi:hypothetical protein